MLKTNLIAIAIVTLGLVMTINTFGQGRTPVSKKDKPKRSDAQIKLMYVANQEEYMAGAIADVRGGIHDKGEETTARTKQTPKPNAGIMGATEVAAKDFRQQVQPGQNSGGTISNQRTKSSSQNRLGNFEIQDIKSPRDVASGQATGIKSPRDISTGQATGKRQHKPIKNRNLGDTGTHEVGH